MISSTFGVGTVTSGEGATSTVHQYIQPTKVALYVHGAGEVSDGWTRVHQRYPLIRAAAALGYRIIACDLGGPQTWGNDTAVARMNEAYTYCQTLVPGKVLILAQSMGGLTSFVWTRMNKEKVSGIVSLIPVTNLTAVHSTDGYAAVIDPAYGPGGYVESTHGPTKNPSVFATQLSTVPMQLWYGAQDTLCLPSDAAAFCSASGAEGHAIPGGHAEDTLLNADYGLIRSFIRNL